MSPDEKEFLSLKFKYVHDRFTTQDKTLEKLDHAINGNGKPGLKMAVDRHERTLKVVRRIAWAVLALALATAWKTLELASVKAIRDTKQETPHAVSSGVHVPLTTQPHADDRMLGSGSGGQPLVQSSQ